MADFLTVKVASGAVEDLTKFFKRSQERSAAAATISMRETTATILLKARLNIASSGDFKAGWLSGLKAIQTPKGAGNSTEARSFIYHKLGRIAGVFEFGATIRPKHGRYLWIPAPGQSGRKRVRVPIDLKSGRITSGIRKATPRRLAKSRGLKVLEYVISKRGHPMLGYTVGTGKRARFKPMFIGIPFANIEKRWAVTEIAADEGQSLVPRFLKAFDNTGA
jgi:hypothetical protein